MSHKYSVRKPPAPAPLPRKTKAPNLSFSFAFLSEQAKFCCKLGGTNYATKLLERLKKISEKTKNDLLTDHSPALRAHPIDFSKTTEPDGFPVNAHFRAMTAYQFSVSANEHGRVLGIMIDHVFFVVWLDPLHSLYDGE